MRTEEAPPSRNDAPPPPPYRFAARTARMKPSSIREILKTTEAPDVISFAGGLPAPELFPVADIAAACQRALAECGPAMLQYGVSEGITPLRQWVSANLAESVGVRASPEQILITHGSQQGLDLIAKVMLDPGDIVLVEDPAYLGALQAFDAYEPTVIGVAADEHGMRPDALRGAIVASPTPPKLLYLIPNFQNPTGRCTSLARRRELATIAAGHGIPILEDDPYGQLRFGGDALPALSSLPEAANWVYLGTSSKVMAPGLRVAWVVTRDRELYEKLIPAKQAADLHSSTFTQRVVYEYVRVPGQLDAHVARLRAAYAHRRDVMLAALARHLPEGCSWTKPEGGLFLWVTLPRRVDTLNLLRDAGPAKVAFVPGAPFWVGDDVRNTMRLNFSNATPANIEEGVRRLGELVKTRLR